MHLAEVAGLQVAFPHVQANVAENVNVSITESQMVQRRQVLPLYHLALLDFNGLHRIRRDVVETEVTVVEEPEVALWVNPLSILRRCWQLLPAFDALVPHVPRIRQLIVAFSRVDVVAGAEFDFRDICFYQIQLALPSIGLHGSALSAALLVNEAECGPRYVSLRDAVVARPVHGVHHEIYENSDSCEIENDHDGEGDGECIKLEAQLLVRVLGERNGEITIHSLHGLSMLQLSLCFGLLPRLVVAHTVLLLLLLLLLVPLSLSICVILLDLGHFLNFVLLHSGRLFLLMNLQWIRHGRSEHHSALVFLNRLRVASVDTLTVIARITKIIGITAMGNECLLQPQHMR